MRLGLASRKETKKTRVLKKIGLHAQNMIIILDSIVNITGGVGPIWPFNKHKNLHFDNAHDIHMSSKNYGESGYSLDLDLLTISH